MGKPRFILVVEDDEMYQNLLRDILEEEAPDLVVISAATIGDGIIAFGKYAYGKELEAIVLNACVPGNTEVNTLPLLRFFRKANPEIPIIATSGNPYFADMLMSEGCSHAAEKQDVPKVILKVLGIAPRSEAA